MFAFRLLVIILLSLNLGIVSWTLKKENQVLDVCYKCHPFYTGKQKILDIAGRVDRFKQMYNKKK